MNKHGTPYMLGVSQQELLGVIRQFNPWWTGAGVPDLPRWRRRAFLELMTWVQHPPAPRVVLLSGARQVGKTTLLLQVAEQLIQSGVNPESILYATFDHPLLKLVGFEPLLLLWREMRPRAPGPEYLLLDEVQSIRDWGTWLKHQADFHRDRRVLATGSALPLESEQAESGVGRWHTIRLPTLSFAEYLQITRTEIPVLPELLTPLPLFDWPRHEFARVANLAAPLVAHFHEYLLRGGFPQTAQVASIPTAQRLLREDIVDKVLKRDMTALYGVRRVLDLEKIFLYLSMHDGGILDFAALSGSLGIKKPTAERYLDLLESAHLVYRLRPFGYGKEVLRGRHKVYLADPAIAGSVLLWGRGLLERPERLSTAVETALFKHLFTRYSTQSAAFSYWRDSRDQLEVDVICELAAEVIPIEVKYRATTSSDDLKGLRRFCEKRSVSRAYLVTRSLTDFGVEDLGTTKGTRGATKVLMVPAPLACLWLSDPQPAAER